VPVPTAPPPDKQTTEKNNEGITAPTQKAGFRIPKTVLWLIGDSLVVDHLISFSSDHNFSRLLAIHFAKI